jgi:hypothetical protein
MCPRTCDRLGPLVAALSICKKLQEIACQEIAEIAEIAVSGSNDVVPRRELGVELRPGLKYFDVQPPPRHAHS